MIFNPKVYEVIETLVKDYGIDPRICLKEGELFFDLNSETKSHMHLYQKGDEIVIKMRYGEEDSISLNENIFDIIRFLGHNYALCVYGRSYRRYGSKGWTDLCNSFDIKCEYGSY